MTFLQILEHAVLAASLLALLYLVGLHRPQLCKLWHTVKHSGGQWRRWKVKTPHDCSACQSGISLRIHPIHRTAQPWSECKSPRGRRKRSQTEGRACLDRACKYFGVTDERVHALVGNGKRGKRGDIQTLRCQACGSSFSVRRNTPLYHLKTSPDRIEICLWLLAEGVDVSVLVRYSGHVDDTLRRWLARAGQHSRCLHALLFVQLELPYLQRDELHAPVAGNKQRSRLWLAIEPLSKILPAMHLGGRTTQDAYHFLHSLRLHLAETCVPAITTDGLRAYFYAITAHFGQWVASRWLLDPRLVYGQLVKRREKRKGDGMPFTVRRMLIGQRWQLFQTLREHGFSETIQTAFIERVNLTLRQGVAPLSRKTWSLAKSQDSLLLHVHWWRAFYHLARPHESLCIRIPGLSRRCRQRTPAMAAGLTDHLWKVGEFLAFPLVFEQGGAA